MAPNSTDLLRPILPGDLVVVAGRLLGQGGLSVVIPERDFSLERLNEHQGTWYCMDPDVVVSAELDTSFPVDGLVGVALRLSGHVSEPIHCWTWESFDPHDRDLEPFYRSLGLYVERTHD